MDHVHEPETRVGLLHRYVSAMNVGAVIQLAICAVHESLPGTKRTWRDVRLESVNRLKADVRRLLQIYGFTPFYVRGVDLLAITEHIRAA
jgi:hypothetical protein